MGTSSHSRNYGLFFLLSLSISLAAPPYPSNSTEYAVTVNLNEKPPQYTKPEDWFRSMVSHRDQITKYSENGFYARLLPEQATTIKNTRGVVKVVPMKSDSVRNRRVVVTLSVLGTVIRPELPSFPVDVILGNGGRISGVSFYFGATLGKKMYQLVYPGKSSCMEYSLDPNLVKGKIVICDGGSSQRVAEGFVLKKAGGVGMILASGLSNGEVLAGDAHHLPACVVGVKEGEAIKAYVSSSTNPMAAIEFKPAPILAYFSARGPNRLNPEILKPDLIAPRVDILAAWTNAIGPTGLDSDSQRTEFTILSSTSLASAHVSGAAALLKSANPHWSPAAIKSAMMTTSTNQLMIDQVTGKASTPFDFGSGLITLEQAMDPGLVYDIARKDYVNFLCATDNEPELIERMTGSPSNCPPGKPLLENLNFPSSGAAFPDSSDGVFTKTFIRTVTNVGSVNSTYQPRVESKPQRVTVTVSVRPSQLAFSLSATWQSYTVTITAECRNVMLDRVGFAFTWISWTDGEHVVRSPNVVTEFS